MNLRDVNVMADTHFGHKNVLKPEYDGRPFPTIEKHDEFVIDTTIERVPPGGILYHLGDVSMRPEHALPFLEAMRKHRVKLHLVVGNHDDGLIRKYKQYFASIDHAAYVRVEGECFYFCHYACRTWRKSNHGSFHVHGHSHCMLPRLGRSMDAGIMGHGYGPITLEKVVVELMDAECVDHHPKTVQ